MAEHVAARWARRTLADLRAGQLSREQIIAELVECDPNGCWTDEQRS